MIPDARLAPHRAWLLLPLATVGVFFWAWRHLLSDDGVSFDSAWTVISVFMVWHLALAWSDRPHRVSPVQERWLDTLYVTVNIPVYNEDPQTVRLVICAIFGQDRLPNRVQVVDDGSTRFDYLAVRAEALALAAFFPQVEFSWVRMPNGGKRRAQAVTFDDDGQADIFVTVDSDTILHRSAVSEGLKPFADPRVTSVAAMMITYNARRNILTRLTELWFTTFQVFVRAAWSRLGCVLVNSGCLAFYSAPVVREALPAYVSETFLGREVQFSDDSLLTLYALLRGRTVQQSTSFAFMIMPETLSHHLRQQLRWMRGSFIRSWWRFRYLPVRRVAYWEHLFIWVTFAVGMSLFGAVFVEGTFEDHRPPAVAAAVLSLILSYGAASRFLLIRRDDQSTAWQLATFCCAPLTGLWTVFVLRPLRLYAIATCRRTGWCTREQTEVVLLKEVPAS